MADTGGQATTTTTTTTTGSSGTTFNIDYVKSPFGIVKLLELIIGIICIGCVGGYSTYPPTQWFMFVACSCFLVTLALLIIFLLSLDTKLSLPWPFVELIYGFVASVLYLIAAIVLAVFTNGIAALVAGTVFAFFNLIVYAVGTFLSFQDWRGGSPGNVA
ncbi:plasmolipin-like [Lingula anatina]|uniref:Plasmolipin-like n=1 Tax=Lingula anatina TaxID=7574 RepID=A0A1S3I7X2_LINAN|nr:plasmolipin-like [Lingula anatina]|eukprot:XP_013393474.1 plasmolipin-like [Lingula anatina]